MLKTFADFENWVDNIDNFITEDNGGDSDISIERVIDGDYDTIYQGLKIVMELNGDMILSFLGEEDLTELMFGKINTI